MIRQVTWAGSMVLLLIAALYHPGIAVAHGTASGEDDPCMRRANVLATLATERGRADPRTTPTSLLGRGPGRGSRAVAGSGPALAAVAGRLGRLGGLPGR